MPGPIVNCTTTRKKKTSRPKLPQCSSVANTSRSRSTSEDRGCVFTTDDEKVTGESRVEGMDVSLFLKRNRDALDGPSSLEAEVTKRANLRENLRKHNDSDSDINAITSASKIAVQADVHVQGATSTSTAAPASAKLASLVRSPSQTPLATKSAGLANMANLQRLRAPLFGSKDTDRSRVLTETPSYEADYDAAKHALFMIPSDDPVVRQELAKVSAVYDRAFRLMRDDLVVLKTRLSLSGGKVTPQPAPRAKAAQPVRRDRTPARADSDASLNANPTPTDEWQLVHGRNKRPKAAGTVPAAKPKPMTFAAVVSATNAETTVESMKGLIMTEIEESCPIRVKSIKKAKNTVVIETVSQAELDQLIACAKFGDAAMTITEQPQKGELVYVPAVDANITSEKFMEQLYSKNLSSTCDRATFDSCMHIRSRIPAAGTNRGGILLESSDANIARVLTNTRVFIGFMSYQVRAFRETEGVPRCFRCNGYNHFASRCTKVEALCGNCSQPGHLRHGCTEQPKCWLCDSLKLPSDHSTVGPNCTEYQRVKQLLANQRAWRSNNA